MHAYLFCLVLGFTGLLAMALLGAFAHGDHGGGGHAHADVGHAGDAHLGHAGAHAHAADAGHGGDGADASDDVAGQETGATSGRGILAPVLAWLSPRVVFSVLVGIGAVGTLLRPLLPPPFTLAVALVGGFVFERLLVGPLWNLVFRFASKPAATLEDALMERAEAVTAFNAGGEGIVRIALDGQVRQVLATLRPAEVAGGVRVRAGDEVRVEEVDAARGRFVVSYLGRLPTGE